MTSLKAMMVSGVRSIPPEGRAGIHFFKPLTLIVGENGAGKTTLIECLKYGCTGELPPASKQGTSFIHDPKFQNSGEVVAQVRIKFESVLGQYYWATRSAKLKLMGKGKRSFASMESKLEMVTPENKRQSVATTGASLTTGISELMGVSTAVLEYVIFCHQEDANWPLGEPKELKSRFDDIFSVSRYTKAMDELKKIRRKYQSDLKVLEEQLKIQEMRKAQRAALLEEIGTKEKQRLSLKEKVDANVFTITKLTEERKHVMETLKHLRKTYGELKQLKTMMTQISTSIAQFDTISSNEYFNMSSEELLKCQQNLSSSSMDELKQKQSLEEQIDDVKRHIQDLEDRRLVLTRQNASISEWLKRLPIYISNRLTLAQAFTKQYLGPFKNTPFSSPFSVLDSESASAILAFADAYIAKIQSTLADQANANAKQLEETNKAIDEKSALLAEQQGMKSSHLSQRKQHEQDIQKLEEEHAQLMKQSQSSQNTEKSRYQTSLARLRVLESDDTEIPRLERLVAQAEAHISILEHHAEVLRVWNNYKYLVHDLDASVALLEEQNTDAQARIKPQIPFINDGLNLFTGMEPASADFLTPFFKKGKFVGKLTLDQLLDPSTLRSFYSSLDARATLFKTAFGKMEAEQFNLNTKISSSTTSVTNLEASVTRTRKELKLKQETFMTKLKRLKSVDDGVVSEIVNFFKRDPCNTSTVEDDDILIVGAPVNVVRSPRVPTESVYFHSLVSAANDSLNRIDSQIAVLKTSQDLYNTLLRNSEKKACCALCLRSIDDTDTMERIEANLHNLVSALPSQMAEAQKLRAECETSIRAFDDLLPLWNEICNLYAQIPVLESEISVAKAENLVLSNTATQSLSAHEAEATAQKKRSALLTSIAVMLSTLNTIEERKTSISNLKLKRKQFVQPRTLPPQVPISPDWEVSPKILSFVNYERLSEMNLEKLGDLTTRLFETTKTEKSELAGHKSLLSELEAEKKSCETIVKQFQADFVNQTNAVAQRQIIEEKISRLQQELANIASMLSVGESEISIISQELAEKKEEKASLTEQIQLRTAKYNVENSKYLEDLRLLRSVHSEVIELETQLKETNASEYDSEIELIRESLEAKRKQLSDAEVALALLNSRDDVSRKHALQAVIQYRAVEQERKELEARIEDMKVLTNGLTIEQVEENLERLDKSIEKEKHLRSSHLGMMTSLEQDISAKRRDLDQQRTGRPLASNHMDLTEDVDTEWKKAYVQRETTKLAIDDLAVSLDALDKSLMKYHSTKMSDINMSLKELWENTYRGGDIDYVKIVAENEDSGPVSPSGSKARKNFNYRVVMIKGGVELDMRGRCSAGQKVLASLMIRMALAETFCLNCGILALDEPTSNLDQANVESLAESLRRVIELRQKQSNFQFIIITHDEEFVKVIGRNSWTDEYYKVKKDAKQHTVIRKCSLRELK